MRVGFAGTPAFASTALQAILAGGFPVPIVLTRPDQPQGRGMEVRPSPVKALALASGVPLLQPATLKMPGSRAEVLAIPLDVLVVAAYGLILPPEMLTWPRHGCINIHASLLPRWRGAAPIERALLEGDQETGISLMQMDQGLDTGPVIDTVRVPIAADDTGGTLTSRLAQVGATAIVATLRRLDESGVLHAIPQPQTGASYAPKIVKTETQIDWTASAAAIARRVRAFDPAPGASTFLGTRKLILRRAEVLPAAGSGTVPGRVLATSASGIVVACGEGALRVLELKPAGGRSMAAEAFVAGRGVAVGDAFTAPSVP
jgi:methionyl-tRNA formyltransferase